MSRIITKIVRKPRHLYYVDGQGNVHEAPMKPPGARRTKKGKRK